MSANAGRFRPELIDVAAIRRIREDRGWTRGQLAARLDAVGVKTIASWEAGTRAPRPGHFAALCQALDVKPEQLLTEPRSQWSLATLRLTAGHEMKDVAKQLGISSERLRYIENGAQPLTPAITGELTRMYQATPEQIDACWQRARTALLT